MFLEKRQAIDYAETRARFRSGEIRVLDASGNVEHTVQRQAGEKIKSGGNHFAEADLIYSSLFLLAAIRGQTATTLRII